MRQYPYIQCAYFDDHRSEKGNPSQDDAYKLPEEQAEYHDVQRCLQRAIATLPERLQMIVRLRYTDQLTFKEIGSILALPEATVRMSFHRAKPLLRQALGVAHVSDLLPARRV